MDVKGYRERFILVTSRLHAHIFAAGDIPFGELTTNFDGRSAVFRLALRGKMLFYSSTSIRKDCTSLNERH